MLRPHFPPPADFPVYHTPEALELSPTISPSILCIGNFDGVHRGHQMLLTEMHRLAQAQHLPAVIITFHPHARMVFQQAKCLTSASEKTMLLANFSPSAVVMIPFSQAYAQTDKQVFLEQLARLTPHTIIVGEDFRFGHQRAGSLQDLATVTEKLEVFPLQGLSKTGLSETGLSDTGLDEAGSGKIPIKSSSIRQFLADNQLEAAQNFLGYAYFCVGTVIQGEQRGRSIGYPTANIQVDEDKLLPQGVFAVRCQVDGNSYQGMANVGARPSFAADAPALEVHLFDMSADLYGHTMLVSFVQFLRPQIKFAGLAELKSQLQEDERQARQILY